MPAHFSNEAYNKLSETPAYTCIMYIGCCLNLSHIILLQVESTLDLRSWTIHQIFVCSVLFLLSSCIHFLFDFIPEKGVL